MPEINIAATAMSSINCSQTVASQVTKWHAQDESPKLLTVFRKNTIAYHHNVLALMKQQVNHKAEREFSETKGH